MKNFLIDFALLLLGALLPLYLRAVVTAGSVARFTLQRFLAENHDRLVLIVVGVVLVDVVMAVDPTGLVWLLRSIGLPAEVSSRVIMGTALCALVLSKGKNKTE